MSRPFYRKRCTNLRICAFGYEYTEAVVRIYEFSVSDTNLPKPWYEYFWLRIRIYKFGRSVTNNYIEKYSYIRTNSPACHLPVNVE